MSEEKQEPVLVSIVTYNDERFLARCLEAVQAQTVPVRVKIFDNASDDATCEIARRFSVAIEQSAENLGYSCGHNRNLQAEDFQNAFLLNADVFLEPDYLEVLLKSMCEVDRVGMAGGKLHRMNTAGERVFRDGSPVLDSTGIYFTPSQRHFDRGSEETDIGLYDRRQLVFGITGAALLCRRAMLEDVGNGDEYLDEDFFAYREDADLAWRAQLRGWRALYEPRAVALHHRRVTPFRRRRLSRLINYHSLKNRYLMRIKNLDSAVKRTCFPYMWIRDLGILVYVLLLEWSSIPAYREVWRLRSRFRVKRRQVQSRRLVESDAIARWFSFTAQADDL